MLRLSTVSSPVSASDPLSSPPPLPEQSESPESPVQPSDLLSPRRSRPPAQRRLLLEESPLARSAPALRDTDSDRSSVSSAAGPRPPPPPPRSAVDSARVRLPDAPLMEDQPYEPEVPDVDLPAREQYVNWLDNVPLSRRNAEGYEAAFLELLLATPRHRGLVEIRRAHLRMGLEYGWTIARSLIDNDINMDDAIRVMQYVAAYRGAHPPARVQTVYVRAQAARQQRQPTRRPNEPPAARRTATGQRGRRRSRTRRP